jgi:hypothetical protein
MEKKIKFLTGKRAQPKPKKSINTMISLSEKNPSRLRRVLDKTDDWDSAGFLYDEAIQSKPKFAKKEEKRNNRIYKNK